MSGTAGEKDVEHPSNKGSENFAPSDNLSQIQLLRKEKEEKERIAQRQEEELSKLMRENSEMKARLERLEALLSVQVPGIFSTNSQAETLSNTPTSQDQITKELQRTQDLIVESDNLVKNLDLITKMAIEESQKLDQLQQADAEQQTKLEEELRVKQELVRQKERDLEDVKINRSNRSVSNSISKTHFQNPKQSDKNRNRENSKVSHAYSHNSWMESDEESVASSQNKSSSRRYQASYGQQKFVSTVAFASDAPNTELVAASTATNDNKRDSPSRVPKREHFQTEPILETLVENQTQVTDPADNPEYMDLISPMKVGTTIKGMEKFSSPKPRSNTNKQLGREFKKGGEGRPGGGGAHTKKVDSKTKNENSTHTSRPAYSERYNNIRSYEDYYKKYKSHIRRGFESLEEEKYVLKGSVIETTQQPADSNKKTNRSIFRTHQEMKEYNANHGVHERVENTAQQKKDGTKSVRDSPDDQPTNKFWKDAVGHKSKHSDKPEKDKESIKKQSNNKDSEDQGRIASKRENSGLVSTQPTIIEEDAQECVTVTEAQSVATLTSTQKKPTRRGGKAARLKRQKQLEKYGKLSRDPNESSQLLHSQMSMTVVAGDDDSVEEVAPEQPISPQTQKPHIVTPIYKSALLPDLDLIQGSDQGESSDEWFQVTEGSKPKPANDDNSVKQSLTNKGSKPASNNPKPNNQVKANKQTEISSKTGGRAEKGDKGESQNGPKGSLGQEKKALTGLQKPEASDQRKKKK